MKRLICNRDRGGNKIKSVITGFLPVLLFIFTWNAIGAQVVTTIPAFPTESDSVVIIFDATQGNGELANVAPPIYAHTGVITNLSTSPSAWRYVIAGWTQNTDKARMTPLGNNRYQLVIKPTVRAFYNVPQQEEILQMAFVFRNADGSRVGRNADGSDIFATVYPAGLSLRVLSPENATLLVPGQQININAVSNLSDSLFLYIADQRVHSVAGTEITWNQTLNDPGRTWIRVVAKNQESVVADSVYCFVRGPVPVAALPDGVINGINYINDSTVTLVLHDPPALKEHVFVIGDFNDWLLDEAYFMNRTPDGTRYWITITNLEPGKEYIFQYLIDGTLRLADPYTEKVIDPWHDRWIPASTYPGLIQYPHGKTTGLAGVLQTAQVPFQWQATNFAPTPITDLVVYELLIRDFVATRDIKTLKDTLDYLQRLGINAIHLMPITEFEGNDSWGYNPSFYFATDKAYGRKIDYQRFIDECHKRGIAVILDLVLNHSFGQSPLVQMYFDPEAGEWGQPTADNPWYSQTCPHPPWCWGFDFNHDSEYTQEFVDRVVTHWLTEFNVDGFRFDFTKGFTNRVGDGWAYDPERIAHLKRIANTMWEVNPDAYVILEHFTDNSEEKVLAEYGMMLWGNMNYHYNEATMGWLDNSNFSRISSRVRNWNVPHLLGYMESHDEERLMFKNLQWGNQANPEHDVQNLTIALRRQELASVFFYTVPGPKLLWQFGELGYDYSINHCPDGTINPACRTTPKPIRWDYLNDPRRRFLYDLTSVLIHLRQQHEVFRTQDYSLSLDGAVKRIKLNHPTMNVVVIGNFDVFSRQGSPQFQHTGWWYEYFSGDSVLVENTGMMVTLAPAEYRIYTNKRLARPALEMGIDDLIPVHGEIHLYPNPTSGRFSVRFSLDRPQTVQADLFDLTGKHTATVLSGRFDAGLHEQWFDSENLGLRKGVYILRTGFGNKPVSRKIIVY